MKTMKMKDEMKIYIFSYMKDVNGKYCLKVQLYLNVSEENIFYEKAFMKYFQKIN